MTYDQREFLGYKVPFLELLGLRREQAEAGRSKLSLDLRHELTNHIEVAHGGVVMTMLDVAMAMALRSVRADGTILTADMSVSFMRPGKGHIVAEGRVLSAGKSLVFCEAEVGDASGKLVAKAMGTFKISRS